MSFITLKLLSHSMHISKHEIDLRRDRVLTILTNRKCSQITIKKAYALTKVLDNIAKYALYSIHKTKRAELESTYTKAIIYPTEHTINTLFVTLNNSLYEDPYIRLHKNWLIDPIKYPYITDNPLYLPNKRAYQIYRQKKHTNKPKALKHPTYTTKASLLIEHCLNNGRDASKKLTHLLAVSKKLNDDNTRNFAAFKISKTDKRFLRKQGQLPYGFTYHPILRHYIYNPTEHLIINIIAYEYSSTDQTNTTESFIRLKAKEIHLKLNKKVKLNHIIQTIKSIQHIHSTN